MNKIVILLFSSRENGNCNKIAEFISNYHNNTNVIKYVIDSQIFAPCNQCNYECLKPGTACPNVSIDQTSVMEDICSSTITYFIVPNYCGYPSANYFAFNERSVGYFNMDREKTKLYQDVQKRFVVISNTEGFERILQQQAAGEPQILYLKSRKYQRQSTAGDLMESAEARADLQAFLEKNLI